MIILWYKYIKKLFTIRANLSKDRDAKPKGLPKDGSLATERKVFVFLKK